MEAGVKGWTSPGLIPIFYVLIEAGCPWTSSLDLGGKSYHFLAQRLPALVPIDEADGPRGHVGAGLGCCHAFDPTCLRATLLTVRDGAQCVILVRGRSPGLWRSQAGMIAVSVLGRERQMESL